MEMTIFSRYYPEKVLAKGTLKLITRYVTDLKNLDEVNKRCPANVCADINHCRTLLSSVPKDANYPETRFQLQYWSVLRCSQGSPQGGGYEHLFMHKLYTFPSSEGMLCIYSRLKILISFPEFF